MPRGKIPNRAKDPLAVCRQGNGRQAKDCICRRGRPGGTCEAWDLLIFKPGSEPGDLIIELVQTAHPVFERKGSDLLAKAAVSLKEALCGTTRSLVTHLDRRGISVQFTPGQLSGLSNTSLLCKAYPLGQVIRIKGEGMPQFKRPFDKGDLYITIDVLLPTAKELSAVNLNVRLPRGNTDTPLGSEAASSRPANRGIPARLG